MNQISIVYKDKLYNLAKLFAEKEVESIFSLDDDDEDDTMK